MREGEVVSLNSQAEVIAEEIPLKVASETAGSDGFNEEELVSCL